MTNLYRQVIGGLGQWLASSRQKKTLPGKLVDEETQKCTFAKKSRRGQGRQGRAGQGRAGKARQGKEGTGQEFYKKGGWGLGWGSKMKIRRMEN